MNRHSKPMRLAISSESIDTYSETFIHQQFENLPVVMRITGVPVASHTEPGGPILPLRSVRGLSDTFRECALRGKRWEGPQLAELTRRLRRAQINVVLANFGPRAVALLPACQRLSIPLVTHFHGYDAHHTATIEANRQGYLELGQHAKAVVVVSEAMRQSVLQLGIPQAKIALIRYGADPVRFSARLQAPEHPLFFGIGRFVDKKAPYLTLLAFHQVYLKYPTARLVLAGEGPLREATMNIAAGLGLSDAVSFPGILAHDEVARQMRYSTAFVQHSITPRTGPNAGDSEGTPVAVLEAMCCALPIIATRHAGIGEVIADGRTGLLCDERDIDAMAEAMLMVAADREFGQSLGARARAEASTKYTSQQYISRLRQVLHTAVHP